MHTNRWKVGREIILIIIKISGGKKKESAG